VTVNAKFPKIKVALEMYGSSAPTIREWTLLDKTLSGVGLLRYDAGTVDGRVNEFVVIIDITRNQVVSIEPYVNGEAKARWDWTEYAVTVTDTEGFVSANELRKPKPVQPRYVEDSPWDSWAEPQRGSRRPQKNVFDWLFR